MSANTATGQAGSVGTTKTVATRADKKESASSTKLPFYERPYYGVSKETAAYFRKEGVEYAFMVVSTALLNPFDRLRTLRQTRATLNKADRSKTSAVTSLDYLRKLFRSEGASGLFRGTSAGVLSWSLKLGIQTSYFERIRNYFFTEGEMNYTGGAKLVRKLTAAVICSFLSYIVSYPFEMTRIMTHIDLTPVSKSQANTVSSPPPKGFSLGGFRKNFAAIKSSYGMIGYVRGFVGGLSTIALHAPIALLCYELVHSMKDHESLKLLVQHLSVPGLAALATGIVAHPLDSIRKRCMVTHYGIKVDTPNGAKISIKPLTQVFSELKTYGFSTPFQGMTITLLRTVVAAGFIAAKRTPEYQQLERLP